MDADNPQKNISFQALERSLAVQGEKAFEDKAFIGHVIAHQILNESCIRFVEAEQKGLRTMVLWGKISLSFILIGAVASFALILIQNEFDVSFLFFFVSGFLARIFLQSSMSSLREANESLVDHYRRREILKDLLARIPSDKGPLTLEDILESLKDEV